MPDKYAPPDSEAKCSNGKCGHAARMHKPYGATTRDTGKCYNISCKCQRFAPPPPAPKKESVPKAPPVDEKTAPASSKPERFVRAVSLGRNF
jgi:hypothetical protein